MSSKVDQFDKNDNGYVMNLGLYINCARQLNTFVHLKHGNTKRIESISSYNYINNEKVSPKLDQFDTSNSQLNLGLFTLLYSDVARAFPSGQVAHPANQNEEENKKINKCRRFIVHFASLTCNSVRPQHTLQSTYR